jgi:carbamoyltransferase
MTDKVVLGISAFYHDSAAAILSNGRIVAAAQEERFTRKKQDSSFPRNAIEYCLDECGVRLTDVATVIFYDKPLVKFDRLIKTYLSYAPKGFSSFSQSMPLWIKDKLYVASSIKKNLSEIAGVPSSELPQLLFSEHHLSHAASAFYASPFEKAAVLCLDGVGEWATTTAWIGQGADIKPLWEIKFPHSIGLLYSSFTYFCGFKVDSGEYKLMGLAPYGRPIYRDLILSKLVDIKSDGSFRLNMGYFNYTTGLTMTNDKFAKLFGGARREPETPITQREMDMAASIQVVTEEMVLSLARALQRDTGETKLCLAGGVALNCVANGRLLREGPFEDIWIQPASGDAGGALGAAYVAWHSHMEQPRLPVMKDAMQGAYLGPEYSDDEIQVFLDDVKAPYEKLTEEELASHVAELLIEENAIGWFQGRMEFGPRALGARSIIGDARSPRMQSTMNLKIKYRESFRPFAPSVLGEKVSEWFQLDRPSPYMLVCAPVLGEHRISNNSEIECSGTDKLKILRSTIPAVTHVDYSARIQTVHAETNPRYHALLTEFYKKTGCPLIVNSSFNVRGEPIVATPQDAYRCFMRTEMDYLILGTFVLKKEDQAPVIKDEKWKEEFELD